MSARVCTCRFCGRDDLTPQGHPEHERWCEDNDNRGIPYEKQKELGILGEGANDADDHPNPDQSVSAGSSAPSLPDVETLAGNKTPGEGGRATTDGGEPSPPSECPLCGHDDVIDAERAKSAYVEEADRPNPKAVLGYELADWTCNDPDCAALWGEKYHEPLPMVEVVNA